LASLNAAIKVNAHPEYKAQPDLLGLLAPDDTDHAEQQSARLSARKFTGKIKRNWRVTSYTALSHTQQSRDEMVLPRLDLEAALDQNIDLNSSTVAATEAQEQDAHTIFTFPKGAKAGTFLHTLFETIDFTHVPDDLLIPHIQSLLDEQGYEAHWLPVLVDLVRQVLHAPLPCYENSAEEIQPSLLNPPLASSQSSDEFMRLGDIDNQARLVEMEFMLSVDNLKGTALSQLCQRLDSLSAQAPSFTFDSTTGLLKGFIDLTFRHQGKYYILDYKSNYLGDQPSAYSKAAMGEAMLDHRYDLQYQIYALALHRLLAQRLPHYDYEQHFGGVIYLFLRGINADNTLENNPGVWTTRPSLSLVQSLDRMFGGE
ncbi:MAG: PD-(D/E)XK nuclease family protein, partial [Pontibacterium sp.]